eukprot:6842280-Prymnesium_polylepis.1
MPCRIPYRCVLGGLPSWARRSAFNRARVVLSDSVGAYSLSTPSGTMERFAAASSEAAARKSCAQQGVRTGAPRHLAPS